MRSFLLMSVVAAVATFIFAAGCDELGVGERCIGASDAAVTGTQIESPALDCPQRLCLKVETTGTPRSTCTATCGSNGDCSGATMGPDTEGMCNSKFVCAVPTVAGPFCCRKMCICRDDLTPGLNQDPIDGGVIQPAACQTGSISTCPNIK